MIDSLASKRGSLWRRWNLHLHAPGTKLSNSYGNPDEELWRRYIDAIEESPVTVFGITDYFCCDGYFELVRRFRERKPASQKIFFANLELRLSESISADGTLPHIHVIFDNAETISCEEKIGRFLTDLNTQSINDDSVRKRCADLVTTADFKSATVSLDQLEDALSKTFGESKPYLIGFPANNNGLRSTDPGSQRKVALADRLDRTSDLFFGNEGNVEWFLKTDRYASGASEPKPAVSGSDAHSFDDLERLSGDVAGFPPTWIKADTTFTGLKQICHEPESRAFIGAEPDVLVRQEQDGTKFLDHLQIDQIDGYDEKNGQWFKGVELPLNPELTAIIGNKGSGKSAIVDIIGLLGESRQEGYFSFLTDDSKSKKFRQPGFAENFEASVTWLTTKRDQKRLSDNCDRVKPETVRYLPQNYFEQLTNEIEIEQFRHEIEEVVFSHVEETEKLGKSTFAELEETKTLQSKQEISSLKSQLRELNIEIIKLEEQSTPTFRNQLSAQIEAKREELKAIDSSKPKEVSKPDAESEEQTRLAKKVDDFTELLTTINETGRAKVAEISELKSQLQEAVSLKDTISNLESQTREEIAGVAGRLSALGLSIEEIVSLSVELKPLDDKIDALQQAIDASEKDNEVAFTLEMNFAALTTFPDLWAANKYISAEIDKLKDQLSTPQRRYQAYVERLSDWTAKRLEIIGADDDPKSGSLNWLLAQQKHIDETLAASLAQKIQERGDIVRVIYQSKSAVLQFYSDLKRSVEERLQSVRMEGFEIEIDASFVVRRDFRREFLNLINRTKRGPYRNRQDAEDIISAQLRETNWDDVDQVLAFCGSLLDRMKNHNGEELVIADQVFDIKDLYNFIFSLEYLSARYELRLGGKNLNELSPGEKGLLLLIFYLQLDRKNTPLVIDQPEDNLDNDSIFSVLARCIRDAKKHRQVILVTHNPNLAVGADAEQIVYVKLEKPENYKFSYESGSIENPALNRRIVDVLEGSQPAFVKRRLKYGIT